MMEYISTISAEKSYTDTMPTAPADALASHWQGVALDASWRSSG